MPYLDGFLLPCPTAAKPAYAELAEAAAKVFRREGASEVAELWGDEVPDGTLTSMPLAVKKTEEEDVILSFIAWPDRATRDAGMKAAMDDEAMKAAFPTMPFDATRMMFGGFDIVVDLPAGTGPLNGSNYVDGMLAAVPDVNRDAFIAHAQAACAVIAEYGALRCVEAWGDDVPDGKITSVPMAVGKEPGETVVLSFIVWPDKATRDAAWPKIMVDARMDAAAKPRPFDGKRVIFGGFTPLAML